MSNSIATRSVCPKCFKSIDANLVVENGSAILKKICPQHGEFNFLISEHGQEYLDLREFYFSLFTTPISQQKYLLITTPQCNLQCPICYLKGIDETILETSIEEIEGLLKNKGVELVIYGAEPTCDERLFEIIELIRKYQSTVVVYTNGLRLEDESYVLRLKSAGVNKILLQFDGFNDEAYKIIRGECLLKRKLACLENLKNNDMPVILEVAILKNVNMDQIGPVFDYASSNLFIKGVTFIGYFQFPFDNGLGLEYCLMPDEIIDELDRHTAGRICIKKVNSFQKVLYSYMALLKRRVCLYLKFYWIYRNGKTYFTVSEMLNIEQTQPRLILIKNAWTKGNKIAAAWHTMLLFGTLIWSKKVFGFIGDWASMISAHISNRSDHNASAGKLLQLDFSTGCDAYRFDEAIVPYCSMGYIYNHRDNGIVIKKSAASLVEMLKENKNNGCCKH